MTLHSVFSHVSTRERKLKKWRLDFISASPLPTQVWKPLGNTYSAVTTVKTSAHLLSVSLILPYIGGRPKWFWNSRVIVMRFKKPWVVAGSCRLLPPGVARVSVPDFRLNRLLVANRKAIQATNNKINPLEQPIQSVPTGVSWFHLYIICTLFRLRVPHFQSLPLSDA